MKNCTTLFLKRIFSLSTANILLVSCTTDPNITDPENDPVVQLNGLFNQPLGTPISRALVANIYPNVTGQTIVTNFDGVVTVNLQKFKKTKKNKIFVTSFLLKVRLRITEYIFSARKTIQEASSNELNPA